MLPRIDILSDRTSCHSRENNSSFAAPSLVETTFSNTVTVAGSCEVLTVYSVLLAISRIDVYTYKGEGNTKDTMNQEATHITGIIVRKLQLESLCAYTIRTIHVQSGFGACSKSRIVMFEKIHVAESALTAPLCNDANLRKQRTPITQDIYH